MKKAKYILSVLLLGIICNSCSDDNSIDEQHDGRKFTVQAQMPGYEVDTRQQSPGQSQLQRVGIRSQEGLLSLVTEWQEDDEITLIFVQNDIFTPSLLSKRIVQKVPIYNISEDKKSCEFFISVPYNIDILKAYTIFGVCGTDVEVTQDFITANLSPVKSEPIEDVKIPVFFKLEVNSYQTDPIVVQFEHMVAYEVVHIKNASATEIGIRDCGLVPDNAESKLWYYDMKPNEENCSPALNLESGFNTYHSFLIPPPVSMIKATIPPNKTQTMISYYLPNSEEVPDIRVAFKTGGKLITSKNNLPTSGKKMQKGKAYHIYTVWDGTELEIAVPEVVYDTLALSASSLELKVGETSQVTILSGSGTYNVQSENPAIATATLIENTIIVNALSGGNSRIIVQDLKTESEKQVDVVVKDNEMTIPEGVIVENGVLVKWPCEAIPENGHVTIPNSVTSIGNEAFAFCKNLLDVDLSNSLTSIGDWAFNGCSSLLSITIPNSVLSIGNGVFTNCGSLASVTLSNSLTSIGWGAFRGCANLSSVIIPNSVTNIGGSAFSYCEKLSSIIIPNSVTSIGELAFFACTNLTKVTLSNSITSIEKRMFDDCTSLSSIIIPNSVTSIGQSAFYHCTSLSSVTIPNSVTSIGRDAFGLCTDLSSVIISNSVKKIESGTFAGCTSLLSIAIPNSVTSIGEYAFRNCTSLSRVTISSSVTNIGELAFADCTSLSNITIPNSVTSIGEYVFIKCCSLTTINVDEGNARYSDYNGVLFNYDKSEIMCYPEGKAGVSYVIPSSVASIASGAFYGCSSLLSITIPNSVTRIGESAFGNCTSLSNITIPNSVTSIGQWVFSQCTSLKRIICKSKTPPQVYTNMGFLVKSKYSDYRVQGKYLGYYGELIVPLATKHLYEQAPGWKECSPIVEEDI